MGDGATRGGTGSIAQPHPHSSVLTNTTQPPHPHPLLHQAEEDAPTILLALPLMTADVWGREFNKLWPRSTLEAAIGAGIGDETVRCLSFISHRLCKELVFKVFDGYVYRLQVS